MLRSRVLRVAAAVAVLGACSTTRITDTWRDKTAPPFPLNRTLAVFMTNDAGMRRLVEDRLAARMPGGVPSYRVIPDDKVQDVEAVRELVHAAQFDGAVVMRLINVQTEVTSPPDFYGYWGYWGSAYDPLAYTTSTIYSVESTLYSLRDGRMVWMGRSETIDPSNAKKLADRSAKAAAKSLKRSGYITN